MAFAGSTPARAFKRIPDRVASVYNDLMRKITTLAIATVLGLTAHADQLDVWIGTSAAKESQGIYHTHFDTDSGKLGPSILAAPIKGPGFLCQHPTMDILYVVGKPTVDGPHTNQDCVASYAIEGDHLKFMNSVPIGDGAACHVNVDHGGKMLVTAQYGGGSVAAYSLNDDGSIKEQTGLIDHEGASGVDARRQSKSHAHYVGFSPDEKFVLAPDLGLDKVMVYSVDIDHAKLTPAGFGKAPEGGGPRHMKFHPDGSWVYVLNELSLSITVFDWKESDGRMTAKQTIPTVSKQTLAKETVKSASEIHVHPSGQYLYSANRGHDTISAFRINPSNGELSPIEIENVRGATPRNFNLTPDGKWLLAAGQSSHTLAVFAIDQGTGELTYQHQIISTPAPICVLFERP